MNTEKHYHMERKCEAMKYLTPLDKDVFVCVIIIIGLDDSLRIHLNVVKSVFLF